MAAKSEIRVRMYRIGFGDFFLLTVPGKSGPAHILIDCGVHKGDIKTIGDCVKDLFTYTGGKLALVIVTHFHADHLSGFAKCADEFRKFTVGAVWTNTRLDPGNKGAKEFKAKLASLAGQVRMQLALAAADDDGRSARALAMVENALGAEGGGNDKALSVATSGYKNKPPVHYYEAGDDPELPPALKGVLTAQILGPAPLDKKAGFTAGDNKAEQYLAAVGESGLPGPEIFRPFEKEWPASPADYPEKIFIGGGPEKMQKTLGQLMPNALAATAESIDGTLNNQSLVVLFTCRGKKLLFVGDAQWGNWAYWLYGKPVKGKDPGITPDAKKILGSIDFYKVGHHGSTNANPIPAITALRHDCAAMCSTDTGFPNAGFIHGSLKNKSEVPRETLMAELVKLTGKQSIRSDWLPIAGKAEANPEAVSMLPKQLPKIFEKGKLFVDYVLKV